jgi:hypothetical protein
LTLIHIQSRGAEIIVSTQRDEQPAKAIRIQAHPIILQMEEFLFIFGGADARESALARR